MLTIFSLFVQQLLVIGKFKVGDLPGKLYRGLLTAAEQLPKGGVILIPGLAELAKKEPGRLIIDDTSSPKYARLQGLTRKLFIPSTGAFRDGYRVLLFLWESKEGRFPIAFAMWHKGSTSLPNLALEGFSLLRNQVGLIPLVTLGDGGFGSEEIVKRLNDYGWPCIFRIKNNRKLRGEKIKRLIRRGYGDAVSNLDNGVRIKVIRRKEHFLQCNRVTWESSKIRSEYARRWNIEEVFRILKSCLNLCGCQQATMSRQALYVLFCCVACACLERHPGLSPYAARQAVISGALNPEILIQQDFLAA